MLIRIEVTRGGFPRELPVVTRTGACAAPRCATRAESPYIRNVLSSVTCRFAPVSHFVSRSPIGTRLLGCTHSHSSHGTGGVPGAGSARRGSRFNVRSDCQRRSRRDGNERPRRQRPQRPDEPDTAADAQHDTPGAGRTCRGGAGGVRRPPLEPPPAPCPAPPAASGRSARVRVSRVWHAVLLLLGCGLLLLFNATRSARHSQSPTGTCKHTLVGQIQVGWPGDRDYHTKAVTR